MSNLQKHFVVNELKGLLKGMEDDCKTIRFNLAQDTIEQLPSQLAALRLAIEFIEVKIAENILFNEEDDDSF